MNNTIWNIPVPQKIPPEILAAGCTPLVAEILVARGCKSLRECRDYLRSGASLLCDPFLLPDMEKAVQRIHLALNRGEKIAVYGDYDVDGITSSALVTDYMRRNGAPDCLLYIPSRLEEGYGLHPEAIDTLSQQGITLIITVDCGVTARAETDYAATRGIDMVITDHHECPDILPAAVAVVNPKRADSRYPFRELAGVGVAFKLLCALERDTASVAARCIDLVAVGTVADVMPLLGENRCIVKAGLQKLRKQPRAGLRALLAASGADSRELTATTISYTLAPRLNASGRLGHAKVAADLLLTADPVMAKKYAEDLCELNRERRRLEQEIFHEAAGILEEGEPPCTPIVLAAEHWHPGVIGIVASRISERYHLPTVMLTGEGMKPLLKGSCRSYGGFNLFEALSSCSDVLEGFGGHALAAGLTVHEDRVNDLREGLAAYYREHPAGTDDILNIDILITNPEQLSLQCVESLEWLEPCGVGNPAPVAALLGATLAEITPIGGGKHLRMRISAFGKYFDAVFFSHSPEDVPFVPGTAVDVAFRPQINDFRGRRTVQLVLEAIRNAE